MTTLLIVSVLAGTAGDFGFGSDEIRSATLSGRVVLLIERATGGLTANGVGRLGSAVTHLGSGRSIPNPTAATGDVSLKFIAIGDVAITLELS